MIETGPGQGLTAESLAGFRTLDQSRSEDLERHVPLQVDVACLVDDAHPAFADPPHHAEVGEPSPREPFGGGGALLALVPWQGDLVPVAMSPIVSAKGA